MGLKISSRLETTSFILKLIFFNFLQTRQYENLLAIVAFNRGINEVLPHPRTMMPVFLK